MENIEINDFESEIILETSASTLTQGNKFTYPEKWGSWRD